MCACVRWDASLPAPDSCGRAPNRRCWRSGRAHAARGSTSPRQLPQPTHCLFLLRLCASRSPQAANPELFCGACSATTPSASSRYSLCLATISNSEGIDYDAPELRLRALLGGPAIDVSAQVLRPCRVATGRRLDVEVSRRSASVPDLTAPSDQAVSVSLRVTSPSGSGSSAAGSMVEVSSTQRQEGDKERKRSANAKPQPGGIAAKPQTQPPYLGRANRPTSPS